MRYDIIALVARIAATAGATAIPLAAQVQAAHDALRFAVLGRTCQ